MKLRQVCAGPSEFPAPGRASCNEWKHGRQVIAKREYGLRFQHERQLEPHHNAQRRFERPRPACILKTDEKPVTGIDVRVFPERQEFERGNTRSPGKRIHGHPRSGNAHYRSISKPFTASSAASCFVHSPHVGEIGTFPEIAGERLELFARAGRIHLDAAVVEVAGIAADTEQVCRLLCEPAVADPLHASPYEVAPGDPLVRLSSCRNRSHQNPDLLPFGQPDPPVEHFVVGLLDAFEQPPVDGDQRPQDARERRSTRPTSGIASA